MKTLRALAGIPVLCISFILVILAYIVVMLGIIVLTAMAMFLFMSAIGVVAAVFIFFTLASIIGLLPSIIMKRSIWGCQKGKAFWRMLGYYGGETIDSLALEYVLVADKLGDFVMDTLPQPLEILNDWFGTGEFVRDLSDKMNAICNGEYKKKTA